MNEKSEFSRKTSITIAIIGQLALLALLVLYKLAIYNAGTEVLLRLRPVDPRDPLRGDYVTVSYDISRIEAYSSENIVDGSTVYVPLSRIDGNFWGNYQEITKVKPTSDTGGVFLKGVVVSGGSSVPEPYSGEKYGYLHQYEIRYGIEDYYIPEGTGRQQELNTGQAYARVAVDENGNAQIKQVYLNDEPWPK